MPGRRGTEKRKLGGPPLTVRFTPETRTAIDLAADAAGITEAAWIREIVCHELGAPLEHAVSVQAYAAPAPAPTRVVLDLVDLRHLVRETNGNLTRLAQAARELGYAGLHAELEASLALVHSAVKQIDKLKLRVVRRERRGRA